jgi:putative Mg2+ transporter-C (MgtC) family protein
MVDVPVLSFTDTVLRLGLATFLGALVGLERERIERAAGIRTHAIVALGAALIMVVSAYGFSDILGPSYDHVELDVSRIAAQVVSGIGFLGAGVIIFQRNVVRGLTTAASVWTVAGLGLACGGGLFAAAGVATVLLLALQMILRPIERRVFAPRRDHFLELGVQRGVGSLAAIETAVSEAGLTVDSLRVSPDGDGNEDRVEIILGVVADNRAVRLLDRLRAMPGTRLIVYTAGTHLAKLGAGDTDEDDEG